MTAGDPVRGGSGAMFDAIAHRYDLLNRILSLGIDQGWRERTVRALALGPNKTVLDLATGTGDLALLVARRNPTARVLGVDPSRKMLEVAERKARAASVADRVELRVGDAQTIELEDDAVDATTIAFGIRNVVDRPHALAEMARVTKAGGTIAILELAEPRRGLLSGAARTYIHEIVPRVGAALSGAAEYRYLARSIAAFPAADEFVAMMHGAGIGSVVEYPLTFGVAHLFVGVPRKARAEE